MISRAPRVVDYVRHAPAHQQALLRRLRRLIRRAAPGAREFMKYGHPHYDLQGSLFALAAQKHYVSLYVAETDVVLRHREALEGLSVGKSCIRMRPTASVPVAAIEDILAEAVETRDGARRRARG